jgi:hypothetical protein
MLELCLLPAQPGVFFKEEDHKYFYVQHEDGDPFTPEYNDSIIEVPSSSHIIALAGGKDFDKTRWRQSLLRKGLSEFGAEYFMERVRDIRADVGTRFHAMAGLSLGSSFPQRVIDAECPEDAESAAIHKLWLKSVLPRIGKVYVIEEPMIHPGGCYGLTPDLVAEIDGILTMCDWKSNQAEHFAERYKWLIDYALDDEILRGICAHLAKMDAEAGKVREVTARVRDGWQMQQGSYAFGVEAIHGLRVERGINFMLSVDGVKEHHWNRPDLDQGWLQFAGGLLLHHQRSVMAGGHAVFQSALNALFPLMRA